MFSYPSPTPIRGLYHPVHGSFYRIEGQFRRRGRVYNQRGGFTTPNRWASMVEEEEKIAAASKPSNVQSKKTSGSGDQGSVGNEDAYPKGRQNAADTNQTNGCPTHFSGMAQKDPKEDNELGPLPGTKPVMAWRDVVSENNVQSNEIQKLQYHKPVLVEGRVRVTPPPEISVHGP